MMTPNTTVRTRRDTVTEGYIPFRQYKTWYRIVGDRDDPGKLPLLCLHGGPGMPHDYMESLGRIAHTGRRVVFYDQLGCGRSDRPDDPALWTVDLFLDELRTVLDELDLDCYHLLGSSWGGMLAMEHALTKPEGLASLVLASSPASIPQWIAEANRLRQDLRPDIQATLARHEADGTTDHPAYEAATMAFYRRHLCRLDPWPEELDRTFEGMSAQVYNTMFGPSEFHATGLLKDWDIIDRLPEIDVPTLITSGAHDEATPLVAETVRDGIPGAEWVLSEDSAHMAFAEEPDRYMHVLDEFLTRVETDVA
jgi:L-proline amide hydrolase